MARVELLSEFLDAYGWRDSKGRLRPAFAALLDATNSLARRLPQMELTPPAQPA